MQATAYEAPAEPRVAWSHGTFYQHALAAASLWLVAGLHLDGWAHAHRPGLESFFTLWHAVLYSGFFALAGVTVGAAWMRRRAGLAMDELRLSLVGVAIFLVGGVGDMLWHTFLGIEVNIEALLSPTHMLLAIGMFLMVSAPLRRAWARRAGERPGVHALVAASLLLAQLAFFTQFLQPGGRPWPFAGNDPTFALFTTSATTPNFPVFPGGVPAAEIAVILGMGGMLVATTMAVGVALLLARRFRLPFGAITLVLGLAAILLGAMRDTIWLAPAWIVGGLAADLALRASWRPRLVAAAALPAALWSAYMLILALSGGVWWSVHAWAGAIAVCTLFGGIVGIVLESSAA